MAAESRVDGVDRYDVFLSFTWHDVRAVELIEQALRDQGLRVFRDSERIEEFAGITEALVSALAASTVLLAYYSARYPTRHACQWELTAAFVAAARKGEPRRRVLAVNPEPDSDHFQPVELEDARYFAAPRTDEQRRRLARHVRERVDALDGPLGDPAGTGPLPARVRAPRRFIGRYPDIWRLHSALRARDFPATVAPRRSSVAVVTGFAGIGKSSLVEQYASLFRAAYPGGVFWTGPFGDRADAGDDCVAEFAQQLAEIAAGPLGLPVRGLRPPELRARVARYFDDRGLDVLWVVDDVPSGSRSGHLDELLIPSPRVRTVLTGRVAGPEWPADRIELHGLTAVEGEALFAAIRPPADHRERRAIAEFLHGCDGHPMLIRAVANSVRARPVLGAPELAQDLLGALPGSVADAVRNAVDAVDAVDAAGTVAGDVLRLAAVLAPAPVPAAWFLDVLAPTAAADPATANRLVGAALSALEDDGLAQPLDVASGPWTDRSWQVHPLVSEAVRRSGPAGALARMAREAARPVLAADPVTGGPLSASHLARHASRLAGNPETGTGNRIRLLRGLVRQHQRQGNAPAAWAAAGSLVDLAGGAVPDLLLAAGSAIAAGRYDEAVRLARPAIDRAEELGDHRGEHRGRHLLARALDHLGRYADADAVIARGPAARRDTPPAWMPEPERLAFRVDRAVALRLRGRFTRARELLAESLPELAGESVADVLDEVSVTARLELARTQLLTGLVQPARRTARGIVDAFENAGLDRHPQCLDAVGVWMEAELTFDLTEWQLHAEHWPRAERDARAAHAEYERTLGPTNPLTLLAAYQRDVARIRMGQPKAALSALAATEELVLRGLGPAHPLRHHVRFSMGLAHMQLKDYGRARGLFAELLDRQRTTLGPGHPDTLATELELGVALGMLGRRDEATPHILHVTELIRAELGWRADLRARAETAARLIRLPAAVWLAYRWFDGGFGSGEDE